MKISNIVKDYFSFNRKEQRGLFVLISILMGLVLSDIFISKVLPQKSLNFSEFAKEVAAFQKELILMDSMEKLEKQKKQMMRYTGSFGNFTDSGKRYKSPVQEIFIIELNSADTFELQRLRGVGPSFAKRIIKYRERLGGYLEKSQLLEIFGMDTAKYNGIKGHITVNPDSIRRINLNGVTFKELLSHPYFPFEVTKNIMIYRKDHKKFTGVEELLRIKNISDSLYRKMKPYVSIE
jgi:competence ComEA-like helix-hairpin-helix protein